MKKQIILLSLIILWLTIPSCSHNYEPTIKSITADPNPVEPGAIVTLSCNASDEDESNIFRDESLTYAWFSAYGEVVQGDEAHTATWTAPATSGIYSVTCTVTDLNNGLDIATVDITVE